MLTYFKGTRMIKENHVYIDPKAGHVCFINQIERGRSTISARVFIIDSAISEYRQTEVVMFSEQLSRLVKPVIMTPEQFERRIGIKGGEEE